MVCYTCYLNAPAPNEISAQDIWLGRRYGHAAARHLWSICPTSKAASNLTVFASPAELPTPGTAWAWGLNSGGQLGNGTNTSSTTRVQVSGLTGVVAVAGGDFHSLAIVAAPPPPPTPTATPVPGVSGLGLRIMAGLLLAASFWAIHRQRRNTSTSRHGV
ncbi:MAG: hypothetical protein EXR53_00340 [Dehalococcoidia bacterium]|nr:hypothetical protein [Dehalococcoidia bacterium]